MQYLLINHSSPFSSNAAQESLNLAIALTTFEKKVRLLFIADGVLQLVKDQQANLICRKDFSKTFPALSLYEIYDIFVDEASILEKKLTKDDLIIDVNLVNTKKIALLMQTADVVFNLG